MKCDNCGKSVARVFYSEELKKWACEYCDGSHIEMTGESLDSRISRHIDFVAPKNGNAGGVFINPRGSSSHKKYI